jgi:hypothetical protein
MCNLDNEANIKALKKCRLELRILTQCSSIDNLRANKSKKKVTLSRYIPWRHMGGEEV